MSRVVYGVFRDDASADKALHDLRAHERYRDVDAVLHRGHVREEDVQLGGTAALPGMIIGGLVVGGLGAILASFVIWPMAGFWFGLPETLLMVIAGSIFGVVAGGVAGASECKDSIRQSARAIDEKGRVLVTAELDDDDVAEVIEAFTDGGATGVRAA